MKLTRITLMVLALISGVSLRSHAGNIIGGQKAAVVEDRDLEAELIELCETRVHARHEISHSIAKLRELDRNCSRDSENSKKVIAIWSKLLERLDGLDALAMDIVILSAQKKLSEVAVDQLKHKFDQEILLLDATKSELKRLAIEIDNAELEKECPICMGERDTRLNPCNHEYCLDCATQFEKCPICQTVKESTTSLDL